VRFEQPISRFAFDATYLKLPAIRTEHALKQFLRLKPANILVRYHPPFNVGRHHRLVLVNMAKSAENLRRSGHRLTRPHIV
jgi:hypothetical protein